MSEKVIYEFRVRQEGDETYYEVRHSEQAGFAPLPPAPWARFGPCRPKAARRLRKRARKRARRHMRQALDSLEQLYGELYTETGESTTEQEG